MKCSCALNRTLCQVLKLAGCFVIAWVIAVGCGRVLPQPSGFKKVVPVAPTVHPEILGTQRMSLLAKPGVWPDVGQLIGYGDRLWFANSVTGINHNSADLYSYNPQTHQTRYEQHLFSQGAGQPAVSQGLLYWPFEDPRFSADVGEYMVTNGEQWQWRVMPEGEAFHTHAIAANHNTLYAGTGAWSGQLQRSQNQGKTWQLVYTHPTPDKQVSRITELSFLGKQLYAGITALQDDKAELLHWQDGTLTAVESWPTGRSVKNLTAYEGWLYGLNQGLDNELTLWRTNGETSEPITALAGHRIQAISTDNEQDQAADETALWAITTGDLGRFLWHSHSGVDWVAVYQFETVRPSDIAVYRRRVYVGGRGENNQGVLLGIQAGAISAARISETTTARFTASLSTASLSTASPSPISQLVTQQIEHTFLASSTYRDGDTQAVITKALLPLATSQTSAAGEFLSQQLSGELEKTLADEKATLFGGNVEKPAIEVVRFYLLWAMGLNRQGQVPVTLLSEPWTEPQNDREKYWHPAPAAIWAVGEINQND